MPTCRDIIVYALKLGKVIGANAQPTSSEAELGLAALQSFYLDLATGGMFGSLADVVASADYEAQPGQRVRALDGAVVSYPLEISDRGVTRPPYDLSLIEVFNVEAGLRTLKLFEAGRGGWIDLADIGLDDEAPLASRGVFGLAAFLATYGGFVIIFSPTLGPALQPLVRSCRMGLIGKKGGDQARGADEDA